MSFFGAIVAAAFCLLFISLAIYYWHRRRRYASNRILPVHLMPAVQPPPPPAPPPAYYARNCCLLCHSNPKLGEFDFCGEACRQGALRNTPLLMEVPQGHVTFETVENRFTAAWDCPKRRPCPPLKKVYKIVESPITRAQYDKYKSQVGHGHEYFRYHGTSRECKLGEAGNQYPCWSQKCSACCILRTSFNVSLANPAGAFGQGIYTSSASNKSSSYADTGVMFLAKVVLGKVYTVSQFAEVKSLPPGYNSVVYNRLDGRLNETIVYEDAAIRPVYLIIFAT